MPSRPVEAFGRGKSHGAAGDVRNELNYRWKVSCLLSAGATGWLNSQPLTQRRPARKSRPDRRLDLHLHQLAAHPPYVRAWAEKYKDQGLVVIGVHSPEFEFEKNVDNVRRAAKDMRVDYPIAIDSDHAMWRALNNQYWPALYIVDAQGPHPPSSIRRGRIRTVGTGSFSNCWPRPEPTGIGREAGFGRCPWCRKPPPIGAA